MRDALQFDVEALDALREVLRCQVDRHGQSPQDTDRGLLACCLDQCDIWPVDIAELSFNATFMRVMQTFARATEFSDASSDTSGTLESKLRAMRVHMIDVCDLASLERSETKALAHAPFLEILCGQGRERAAMWLDERGNDVGKRSSVDVQKWFG